MSCYPINLSERTKKKFQDRLLPNSEKEEKVAETKPRVQKAAIKKLPKPIKVKARRVAEASEVEDAVQPASKTQKDPFVAELKKQRARNNGVDFSYEVKKKKKWFPKTRKFSRSAVEKLKGFIAANEAGKEYVKKRAPQKVPRKIQRKKSPSFISLEGKKLTKPTFRKTPKKIKKASRVAKKPKKVRIKKEPTKRKIVKSKKSRSGRYPAFKYPRGYGSSLKNHSRPAKGCLPPSKVSLSQSRSAMRAQNLTMNAKRRRVPHSRPTAREEKTLGAGLRWLQYLNGGPLKSGMWSKKHQHHHGHKHYSFNVGKKKFCNGANNCQRGSFIYIRRTGKSNLSVAQYVHEYSHFIGNNGGYAAYRKAMKGHGTCLVSNYSIPRRFGANENFAEVFTAFATAPEALLNNNFTYPEKYRKKYGLSKKKARQISARSKKACKKAFEFYKNWFKKGERVYECLNQ